MNKCHVVGCHRTDGLRTILIPFYDIQLEVPVCLPCEIQIDERHASSESIYTSPSDDRAVTEKATKNVRKTDIEDKNVEEGTFDDSEE